MTDGYAQETIWLNGRTIPVSDILAGRAEALTDFEENTIDFIQLWLSGQQSFTIHTSGSTGTPKPIIITREQMTGSAKRTLEALTITAGQSALICLPTQYIAGRMMIVRALVGNLKIVAVEPSSNPLLAADNRVIDFAAFVPLQLHSILESSDTLEKINTIKTILVGGAKINPTTIDMVKELKSRVILTYGMTETISHVAFQYLNRDDAEMNFNALPGISFSTDDRDCLIITDENLAVPVITNDRVRLISATAFQLLGRYDDMINSGGIKYAPESIENQIIDLLPKALKTMPFIVGPYPDPLLGEAIALYMEGCDLKKDQIMEIQYILNRLKKRERPRKIILISKFCYTTSGKINRRETIEKGKTSTESIIVIKIF
ncbi:MAG: AMP-binding protein [Cyclobacteriaceae bacterium]|nr:AMP-binding protein [Cyclobacteriaceae bacterium]